MFDMKNWKELLTAIAGILVVALQIINTILSTDIERTVTADHQAIEAINRMVASDHELIVAARADQQQLQAILKAKLSQPTPSPTPN